MKDKILIDGRLLSVNPTGISRYCVKMIEVIAEQYGEEQLVVLVNNSEVMRQNILLERLSIFQTGLKPFNLVHWLTLSFLVFFKKPRAYVCLNYSGLCFKRPSLKLVVTVYDLMFSFVEGFFGGGIKDIAGRFYYGLMVPRAIKLSNLALTISEASQNDIMALYGKNAVNISGGNFLEAQPEPSIIKRLNLLPHGYFLFAGNSRPHKNIPQLLRVFNKYRRYSPDAKLIIVGHKGETSSGVIYPGFVTENELVALYQSAKAFVFPSLYEGFGLPVLEAIINGCPVIASDIPAFREFKNNNMIFYSSDDGLYNSLLCPPTFDNDSLQAFVSKFTWGTFCKKLAQELLSLIKK
ncbi:glycosyltransferase family 1 protein [Paraglaciecola sp. 20A4]|uniref:glycosyltransferase family 4 protein n=1 Tax=Paraglaciecola sp. 20A4 TaxID=2687288 RepID=UPI00197D6441|nr:glycosyltransferase family 1 protein [Paraglaciecola sp. 20A4]